MSTQLQFDFVQFQRLLVPPPGGCSPQNCPKKWAITLGFLSKESHLLFLNEYAPQAFPQSEYSELYMPGRKYMALTNDPEVSVHAIIDKMERIFAGTNFKIKLAQNAP